MTKSFRVKTCAKNNVSTKRIYEIEGLSYQNEILENE